MTTIKTLIGAVALIAASTSFAQSNNSCTWFPKGEDGPGTIGKRYVEAGVSFLDKAHTAHNTNGTSVAANLPICAGLDLTGGYSYSWFNRPTRDQWSIKSHYVGGNAVFYNTTEDGVKPFVALGLGYAFSDANLDADYAKEINYRNHIGSNYACWSATVGAEFPYKWISVIPTITYNDDMQGTKKSSQSFVYSTEVNTWITPQIGVFASVSYYAQQHVGLQTWGSGLGVRVRF